MGFFDDDIVEEVKAEFTPIDLSEANVRAIFDRCLAKPDSKKFSYASPKDPAFPAWWEQHKSEWEA